MYSRHYFRSLNSQYGIGKQKLFQPEGCHPHSYWHKFLTQFRSFIRMHVPESKQVASCSTLVYKTIFIWNNIPANCLYLWDICILYLGRYVGYMVGHFVLRRRVRGAVKRNFRPYNQRYTSPNENFEYGYPHSNALFNIYSSKDQYFVPNVSFVSGVK